MGPKVEDHSVDVAGQSYVEVFWGKPSEGVARSGEIEASKRLLWERSKSSMEVALEISEVED